MSVRLAIVVIAIVSLLVATALAFAVVKLQPGNKEATDSTVTQPVGQEPVELEYNEKRILISGLGMTCSSCRAAVSSALSKVEGIKTYSIDVEKDWVILIYKKDKTSPEAITEAITKGGYKVGGIKELD